MNDQDLKKRRIRIVTLAVAALVFLFIYVEDWGRDFTQWQARLEDRAEDSTLRPLVAKRPTDQMVEATRMAARRISNWRYVGDAVDGDTTLLYFVRTNRILRLKDDVTVQLERRDNSTVVRAESASRLHFGDLGRNPRNLRRFINELQVVLEGSVPAGVLATRGMPRR